jgi:hypothetical protein
LRSSDLLGLNCAENNPKSQSHKNRNYSGLKN